jgi:CheY-like chemotaxis protein
MEAIGTLGSGIAHNFRNILAVFSMNCHILKEKYKDDSELLSNIDLMISYGNRGASLIDDLMRFGRQEPKKKYQLLNLSEILKETYKIISDTFNKMIDIRLNIPESIPLNGDYSELSQIFLNLCTNARDAMPDGGILQIDASIDGKQAYVAISDTGEGMDRETMGKCFEPFFTTKPMEKGTGLGLSTTYGIVKKHRGEIKVHSVLGQGSTFKPYFPLSFNDDKIEQATSAIIESGQGKKILVVDDETEICNLMEQLLTSMDYMVKYTDNGKRALDIYKSWRPDVVLLDRNMPEIDGISCAERIISYDSLAKIIIISGYDENGPNGLGEHQNKLIKGYLTKPIKINELNVLLTDLLNT